MTEIEGVGCASLHLCRPIEGWDQVLYRGYDFEQKSLMVGWQITITKDERFVRHGSVVTKLDDAMVEARKYVDDLLVATE